MKPFLVGENNIHEKVHLKIVVAIALLAVCVSVRRITKPQFLRSLG